METTCVILVSRDKGLEEFCEEILRKSRELNNDGFRNPLFAVIVKGVLSGTPIVCYDPLQTQHELMAQYRRNVALHGRRARYSPYSTFVGTGGGSGR